MKYVDIPEQLEQCAERASDEIFWDIRYNGCCTDIKTAIFVKIVCIALIPYFKKYGIGSIPIFQSIETEDEDFMVDIWDEIEDLSCVLFHRMTEFGWKIEMEENFYDYGRGEVHSIMDFTDTPLKNFSNFILGLIESIRNTGAGYYDITAIVVSNKRLGKFLSYANKNHVNKELLDEITAMVSKIECYYREINFTQTVFANEDYKILYIFYDFSCDTMGEMYNLSLMAPLYAYNLERLLDEAYSIYPIDCMVN